MVPPPVAGHHHEGAARIEWQPLQPAVGTPIALRGTTLSAEVTGTVREIGFENGSLVKKGQVIVRPGHSAEQAQLQSAQADMGLAKQTLERNEGLRRQEVNTQADLEVRPGPRQADPGDGGQPPGDHQQEGHPRAVRRPGGHPCRGAWPGGLADAHRLAADGEPDLRRVPASAADAGGREAGPEGHGQGRRLPRCQLGGDHHHHQPRGRSGDAERADAGHGGESGRPAQPGMFANVEVEAGKATDTLVVPATSVIYAPTATRSSWWRRRRTSRPRAPTESPPRPRPPRPRRASSGEEERRSE